MRRGILVSVLAGLSAVVALGRVVRRRRSRIELRGRVAIVTGGGRGLGLAITRELVRRGCRVAICGRDGATVERAADELRKQGADVFAMATDASDPDQVQHFVFAVLKHFDRIDILVNNAGQCFVGPVAELTASDFEAAFRNIFWVQYHPTMAVLPYLREQGFGRIANVTSFAGKVPIPHQASYVAGKHAATGFSETLTAELAKEGIRVSTITPPPLRNGAPLHVHFKGEVQGEFAWFTRALTSKLSASSAERTARVVVDALEHADPLRSVGVLGWGLARLHGLAPNLTAHVLAVIDRRLPPALPSLLAPAAQVSAPVLGADVAAASASATVQGLAASAERDESRYTVR